MSTATSSDSLGGRLGSSAEARNRYGIEPTELVDLGDVGLPSIPRARALATRINLIRDSVRFPESAVRTGDLYGAGLLHELSHLVLELYREGPGASVFAGIGTELAARLGDDVAQLIAGFVDRYPPPEVVAGITTRNDYIAAVLDDPVAVVEELVALRMANENPALERMRDLYDDRPLGATYLTAIEMLDDVFADGPPVAGGKSLLSLLREPFQTHPTSIRNQLEFIRDNWAGVLGDRFDALLGGLLRALDVIAEDAKWGLAGPPGPSVAITTEALGYGEYERFSTDSSWMPEVVMMAKSTYVWLDQLSKTYQRDIVRLDQVPDEELDRLAEWGFTALWLIGLWERSTASRTIKHMRGDPDAVASAYSLYDYVIAHDLGGDLAYENLRNRAWQRGIRLASDMVPNHVGIDGKWVIEHPDRFLSLPHPPYPGYSFGGENLSSDDRVSVRIEDHYWDGSDAAVVFQRVDNHTGDVRYIYHGNDGTAMPWNDTAQLNYLDASTREAVIQTILHVARKFPIIRFDAAMTLAKQHIQRLWFPQPGHGGAIPSRSEHGMTREEFDRLIPNEFWREVVDRVAAEVPDTLLLAEAFWMLEGYFVRTLGMHRVYNSAFMHMTSKEDNSEYRRLIKNTIEFDPQILQRYVNFMNNPDEETAVAQFGKDDKYVGVATLMATMPGLPMFGHGQVEGFSERYGMEFRKARWDEQPDDHLIERHRRELFPLLHRRRQFAGAENFRLYDVVTEHGDVNDNVFAYSNRGAGRSSLVLYNNAYERATGWIRVSSPFVVKIGEESRTQTDELAAALGLRAAPGDLVRFREIRTGLEYLRRSEDIARHGFFVQLDGYQSRVFLDFEELHDAEAHLHALAEQLGGGGVPSLRVAVDAQLLQPLRDGFGDFIDALLSPDGDVPTVRHDLVDELDRYDCDLDASSADFLDVAHGLRDDDLDRLVLARVRTALPEIGAVRYRLITAAALIAARMSCRNGAGTEAALRDAVAARLGDQPGLASLVPAVASHYRWAQRVDREPLDEALRATLDGLTSDPDLAPLIGVHEHEDRLWFNRERYEDLVTALTTAAVVTAPSKAAAKRAGNVARELLRAAERAGYDWEALTTKAT